MNSSKIVDEIIVDLDFPKEKKKRTLFVVFSSKEPHVEIVIDSIEQVMKKNGYDIVRLDAALKSGDSQYSELSTCLSKCSFAFVILDGFRPNVLFEYGILKGLGKPTIVLLEGNATVDIKNYHEKESDCPIPNPKINMDKHFSDVKDRFYIKYNKLNPKSIRKLINEEYKKLKNIIDEEFIRVIFPDKEDVISELRLELSKLLKIYLKDEVDLVDVDEIKLKRIYAKIEKISAKNSIVLPASYFFTIAQVYEALNKDQIAFDVLTPHIGGLKNKLKYLSFKAYLLKKLNRPLDAISTLEKAIRHYPSCEPLWHNKALLLEQLGRKRDALSAYKVGVSLNSGCSKIHFNYGLMLYQANRPQNALKQFELALALKPDNSDYLMWKGKTIYKLKDKAKAFGIVEKAVKLKPNNANAWFTLGLWEQDKSKAIIYFTKAIKVNPNHYGALCSKGSILAHIGKCNEAFKIFWSMRDKCPVHKQKKCKTLIKNIFSTIPQMGEKPSDDQLEELLVTYKNNAPFVCVVKARASARKGEFKESIRLFDFALKKLSKDSSVWYDKACTYALMRDKTNALVSLKKAVALNPSLAREARGDKDFNSLLNDPNFQKIVNTKPRHKSNSR